MVRVPILPAIAAGLLLLGAGPALAQNWQAEPRYGTLNLSAGFDSDPRTVSVVAGGANPAGHLGSSCAGNIDNSRPDVDLNYTAGSFALSIYVESSADTTLVVYDPNGRWLCNDDFSGQSSLNPGLVLSSPPSGNYNIWIGSFGRESYPQATLHISELGTPWSGGGSSSGSSGGGSGSIEWGDNTSQWANDGECDDPRFAGPGMAQTLLDVDRFHDANDCRSLYERGQIYLRQ